MAIKKKTSKPSTRAKPAAKKPATKAKRPVATKKKPARGTSLKKVNKPAAREKKTRKRGAAAGAPAANPIAHALARKIAESVLDKKALDVVILDVRGMTSYADYFVVASGESERQVTAMADAVAEKIKKEDDRRPIGTEGTDTGQWVLIDYGDVVAHLFFNEVRSFYDLEGLWADAPREAVH